MARRRRNEEIAFGSDSFLDIVANIVGILIILIVVAGVRMSQMPAVMPRTAIADQPTPIAVAPMLSIATPASVPMLAAVEPEPLPRPPAPPAPIVPPKPIEPSPELLAKVESAAVQLDKLKQDKERLATAWNAEAEAARMLQQQIATSMVVVATEQQMLDNGRRAIAARQTEVETGQRDIAGMHLELADVQAAQPPPQELRHKLTPVGKVVQGAELHFLLSRNRITVVPVDSLTEKLKEELMKKKSQLIRGQTRVGTVGPVRGFVMEYVVEREAISLREELQLGTAVVRLGISEWRMLPQPSAVYESADEALLPRSRFLDALRSAGPGATLTFWVYPDSFTLFRELQDFAHDNGFDVAGRPLPVGIPITGSSSGGSKSVAQ